MGNTIYKSGNARKVELNEKDKLILNALLLNARASYAQIAEETGLLRDTIAKRVSKMKSDKLILSYETWIDPLVLGYNFLAHLFIKLEPVPEIESKDFINKLVKMKNITHITTILGNYDLVLVIAAKDALDFDKIVNEIKSNPKKVIQTLDVGLITGDPKVNNFSGLL
jgi:DNA-binding Lrp family transcriptional regulator